MDRGKDYSDKDQAKYIGDKMYRKLFVLAVITSLMFFSLKSTWAQDKSQQNDGAVSKAEFIEPPLSARPGAFWPWLNGYVSLPQITRELEEMKDKGMSGADIWDVAANLDPDGIVPAGPAFLGPESVKAICHAIKEGTRLNLRLGLISSSSWNAGGPWVKIEDATKGLYHSETVVRGPNSFSQVLPFPKFPKRRPELKRIIGPDGLPPWYKDVAVLAFPHTKEKVIKDMSSIINLTSHLDEKGRLSWDVPSGTWVIIRFVCINTGQHIHIPSPNSDGLAIDHFDPQATQKHMQYIIDKLLAELGSFEDTALKYMETDSLELLHTPTPSWTTNFVEEFKNRRGYDPTAYLPILIDWDPLFPDPIRNSWKIENNDISKRFHNDWVKTLSSMLVDAHQRTAKQLLNKHGLLLCAESGGPGLSYYYRPVNALKGLGAVDIPRGEFWFRMYLEADNIKEVSSAAHIYGRKIVDAESFTSGRHWLEGPFEYKQMADLKMCEGLNHFTFHVFEHNPPEAGLPGWVYYAGEHINVNTTWWPKAKPFVYYLARCCYLLQQGLFVGDVCYYNGDQAPNFVPRKHVDPSLGFGYDYDVTNTEVILTRMGVRNGKIILPDGMNYELLVLPDRPDMELPVLKKLEELVKAGATVVGRKPIKTNTLTDYPNCDREVKKLADKLWGPCDGKKVKENSYGKGKVIWGRVLKDILLQRGIGPDFTFRGQDEKTALDYIHRRTKNEDIYFVINKNLRWEQVDCIFRIKGKRPELWMPDTGESRKHVVYDFAKGGTKVNLCLPPAGSVFVVFREKADKSRVTSLRATHKIDRGIFPVSTAEPGGLPLIETIPNEENDLDLRVWKAGTYVLESTGAKITTVAVDEVPEAIEIPGPWEIRFPKGWGAPASKVFPELISWTADINDGVKYFSGTATYHKEFEIPTELLGNNRHLVLDLGDVRFVADAYLNGKHLGIRWKPPFRYDIADIAKPGKNKLTIEVTNLWANRLIGDSYLPKNKRYCKTNMAANENTGSTTWPHAPWPETNLLESGLLGPVRVITAVKVKAY